MKRSALRARWVRWKEQGLTVVDRAEAFAVRHPVPLGRYNLALVAARGWRRVIDVRVTGLAAEMTYYAIVSILPLLTALGATLGFLERVVGAEQVARLETTVVDSLAGVFEEQVTDEILAPLVEGLLREERSGVAFGSLAIALWLASRMFRAAIRALDDAYRVPERRGLGSQLLLGLGLSLGAILTLTVLLSMVVVGPLLGGGQQIAVWLGQGETFEALWSAARWPVIALVCIGSLALLYRYGPNVANTWRDCLPGAVVGTVTLVGVAFALQAYLGVAAPAVPELGRPGEAVAIAAQTLGAALAVILWLWLSSIMVLTGGVVNAELAHVRSEGAPIQPADGHPEPSDPA